MTKEKVNVDKFVSSVNDMINSKYILVDRKIAEVLSAIAETSAVYNLIAECMVNFDFLEEWKRATKGSFLKLPEAANKRISFIFCMLNNIDDQNIDITKILEKYFSYDSTVSPYELFNKTIMVEFKRLILCNLEMEEENGKLEEVSKAQTLVGDEYEMLSSLLTSLSEKLKIEKKIKKSNLKIDDIIAVVATFKLVVKNHELDYFYAFLVSLNQIFGKDKRYIDDIQKIIDTANKLLVSE